jgi:hypothetical protein
MAADVDALSILKQTHKPLRQDNDPGMVVDVDALSHTKQKQNRSKHDSARVMGMVVEEDRLTLTLRNLWKCETDLGMAAAVDEWLNV